MEIRPIQSRNFESQKRFVSPAAKDGIKELIGRMREDTVYTSNGDTFISTIFKEISDLKGNVRFQDGRIYVSNKLSINNKDLKGNALFKSAKQNWL